VHLLSVFSLRNRALIALVTIVVGVFGGIALTSLRQELIPSITLPQLVVVTSYPGASPDVVETDVSTPIETALQGVDGLEQTSATSSSGASSVSASFAYGTSITAVEQDVQLAINRIEGQLPSSVDPQVITGSIDDLPVIQLAVTPGSGDEVELASRLETSAIVDLEQLDGVREAALLGQPGQRVTITPDRDELLARGLSTQSIRDALDANGVLLAAGEITEGDSTLTVQSGDRLESVDEIAAVPLLGAQAAEPGTGGGGGAQAPPADGTGGDAAAPAAPADAPTLGDVATVEVADDPVTGISRVNGEDALTISITKRPDANTVEVSRLVTALIPDLEAAAGDGAEITVVFDQAPFIEQSIETLAVEGVLGLGFAVIIILIFLLSVRSTLVTAISIPVSVLITFIGMWATGYSMNILTLGALTISIGRVVDDSIVVIENIKRHLGLGLEPRQAILTGVREVAVAVTSATVTTVAVFLPLALVSDITGELFRPFALTVTMALGASLFVSLTIVPVLAYWFLGSRRAHKHAGPATAVESADADAAPAPAAASAARDAEADELDRPTLLQRGYLPVIRWTLRFPAVTMLLALLVLVGSGALATQLKFNFIGDSGQNTLTVTQTLDADASLEATDEAATRVERALIDTDGVETVQLSIGSGGSSIRSAFGGGGDVTFSITTDPDAEAADVEAGIRDALADLDDVGEVSLASADSGFASSDIEIDISAASGDDLERAADDVLTAVQDLDVTAQAESNLATVQPYLAISVDRAEAARLGLSEIAVGGLVADSMLPASIGTVQIDDDSLDVYIDDPRAPTTVDELRAFEIPTATGPVRLDSLAEVGEVDGPSTITTERGVRSATVSITPSTDDIAAASAAVSTALADVDLPDGATAELGGVTADQNEAFAQLGLALLAAILIVYTVMVATFRSLRQPLLLLVSVPFAATGAIILQVVSGIPLGVPSLIGVLMLIGIVVTNAIVLVDLVNQYRERGRDVRDAIVHGAARRLRPILMTALATIFALVPMALGITGHGGFISQPLAIVVIGGLVSSTVLTLIVLPVLYWLVEGAKERRATRREARALAREQQEASPAL
jgi:hydrophobic/amphiphilic exporter-1 (mainly G- bacteria), HAE1 family